VNLQQYLIQIKAGRTINFSRFISLLPEFYDKQKYELFNVTLQAPQRWLVSCSDETLTKLEKLVEKPNTRLQATEMGDSHLVRVSFGFVLVYHGALTDNRPDVVYLEQGSYLQGYQAKKRLLIIENEENFFQPVLMLRLAEKFTNQQFDLENTDVALGCGGRVISKLALSWYQQYNEILCLFDYDAAGLKMYQTLKAKLGEHVQFLQPQSYSDYEQYFKMQPKSHSQLVTCINLAEKLGFTGLSKTVRKHRKFMEQEMLLLEIDDE